MTAEFKTAKGWRWFIYIFSPPLMALCVYVGFNALTKETSNVAGILILIPVSLGGIIFLTYGVLETMKGRLIIASDSISRKGLFGTRTLAFADIKGFRADDKYIHILSGNKNKKSIRITAYVEKSHLIIDWLSDHFTNLDAYEAHEEELDILTKDEFGVTPQAREYRLSEAKRTARYINILGTATGIWLFFYPYPYTISLLAGMAVPLMAFGSLLVYRGLIRFDEKKKSAHPSILYGFLFPAAGLGFRAMTDFEILEYSNLWIVIIIFTLTLTAVLIVGTKEFKFRDFVDYFTALSLAGMILAYSFGVYVISNCVFDRSKPDMFTSKVVEKEMSSGKSTTYYLTLEPWGPRTETERVSVTKTEYETTDPGDTVDIYLRQGYLRTPWFYIVTE